MLVAAGAGTYPVTGAVRVTTGAGARYSLAGAAQGTAGTGAVWASTGAGTTHSLTEAGVSCETSSGRAPYPLTGAGAS